jgi:rhamnosyltransferase
MTNSICGVVVTYHPDSDFENHIAALRPQVGALVVVDNRSHEDERLQLREMASRHSFVLLENDENRGIASALNQGVIWALEQKAFQFVAFFDQDSEVNAEFMVSMLETYYQNPKKHKVAVVAPTIYNQNTGQRDVPKGLEKGTSLVAQTSGSVMPLEVFQAHGLFKEELFIDFVDYEFCLRVVGAGWSICYCKQAILSHVPGSSRRCYILGWYLATTYNYSALRHYFMTRNAVWVIGNYWRQQPGWCAWLAVQMWINPLKAFLFETDFKLKLRCAISGIRDGMHNRLGPTTLGGILGDSVEDPGC